MESYSEESHGQEPTWMRAIPTSLICNWFLAFAALYAVITGGALIGIILSIGGLNLVIVLPILLLGSLLTVQFLSLYHVCKRGVKKEEGFRRRRQ